MDEKPALGHNSLKQTPVSEEETDAHPGKQMLAWAQPLPEATMANSLRLEWVPLNGGDRALFVSLPPELRTDMPEGWHFSFYQELPVMARRMFSAIPELWRILSTGPHSFSLRLKGLEDDGVERTEKALRALLL